MDSKSLDNAVHWTTVQRSSVSTFEDWSKWLGEKLNIKFHNIYNNNIDEKDYFLTLYSVLPECLSMYQRKQNSKNDYIFQETVSVFE